MAYKCVLSMLTCSLLFCMVDSMTVFDDYVGNEANFAFENSFWADYGSNIFGIRSLWNLFTGTGTISENARRSYFIRRTTAPYTYSFKDYIRWTGSKTYVTLSDIKPEDNGIYWLDDGFRNLYQFRLNFSAASCNDAVSKYMDADIWQMMVCHTSRTISYELSCDGETIPSNRSMGYYTNSWYVENTKRRYEIFVSDTALARRNVPRECKLKSVDGKFSSSNVALKRFESIDSCKLSSLKDSTYKISCETPTINFVWVWNNETMLVFERRYDRFMINAMDYMMIRSNPDGTYRHDLTLTAKFIDRTMQHFRMEMHIDNKYHITNTVSVRM